MKCHFKTIRIPSPMGDPRQTLSLIYERRLKMDKLTRIMMMVFVLLFVVAGFAFEVGASDEININTAPKEELMQLEGVGGTYAEKIIEYRETNGFFENPEDIMNVKGIGLATYEKNKDRISVQEPEEP